MNDDRELDRMLARGKMSGAARERVLGKLLQERRARKRRLSLLWAAPILAAAAALVLWLRPTPDGFRARGVGEAPLVDVTCKDGAGDRCPRGGLLVFRVDGASRGGFLAAWAEPVGGGPKIWYFAPGAARLNPEAAPQILPRAVQIGAEQPPGDYEIHARIVDHELLREEVEAPVIRRLTVLP